MRTTTFSALLLAVVLGCDNGDVANVESDATATEAKAPDAFQSAADRCPACARLRSLKLTRAAVVIGPNHPEVVQANYNLMQEWRRVEALHGPDSQEALYLRERLLIEREIARRPWWSPEAAERLEVWLKG